MKLVYNQFGDYENNYWAIVYYIPSYFLYISLLLHARTLAFSRLQRHFLGVGIIYFGSLLLTNLVCLFKIELFNTLLSGVGKWSVGAVTLLTMFLIINYIRWKSHDIKNQRKVD